MRKLIASIVIGLFFLTAAQVYAVVGIDGKCLEECKSKGDNYGECRNQCITKPESTGSVSPQDNTPKFHLDCSMSCRSKGSSPDFCKSICTY
jgi:hypothetical protein